MSDNTEEKDDFPVPEIIKNTESQQAEAGPSSEIFYDTEYKESDHTDLLTIGQAQMMPLTKKIKKSDATDQVVDMAAQLSQRAERYWQLQEKIENLLESAKDAKLSRHSWGQWIAGMILCMEEDVMQSFYDQSYSLILSYVKGYAQLKEQKRQQAIQQQQQQQFQSTQLQTTQQQESQSSQQQQQQFQTTQQQQFHIYQLQQLQDTQQQQFHTTQQQHFQMTEQQHFETTQQQQFHTTQQQQCHPISDQPMNQPQTCLAGEIPKCLQIRSVTGSLISYAESKKFSGYRRAAHACIWAPHDKSSNFGDLRALIMMHLRFDGTFGFPGGLIESEEDIVDGLNREMKEEIGWDSSVHSVNWEDYHSTQVDHNKTLVLHFFVTKITVEQYIALEKKCLLATEYGNEVFGTVRVPLYTMTNMYNGLPAFLNNKFVGTAKQQLLLTLYHKKIMTEMEISDVLYKSQNLKLAPNRF